MNDFTYTVHDLDMESVSLKKLPELEFDNKEYEEELELEWKQDRHNVVKALQMIDYDHFVRFKDGAINGLQQFGGIFEVALGDLLAYADDINAVKIIRTWENQVTQHEMLWRIHEAKQKAEDAMIEG